MGFFSNILSSRNKAQSNTTAAAAVDPLDSLQIRFRDAWKHERSICVSYKQLRQHQSFLSTEAEADLPAKNKVFRINNKVFRIYDVTNCSILEGYIRTGKIKANNWTLSYRNLLKDLPTWDIPKEHWPPQLAIMEQTNTWSNSISEAVKEGVNRALQGWMSENASAPFQGVSLCLEFQDLEASDPASNKTPVKVTRAGPHLNSTHDIPGWYADLNKMPKLSVDLMNELKYTFSGMSLLGVTQKRMKQRMVSDVDCPSVDASCSPSGWEDQFCPGLQITIDRANCYPAGPLPINMQSSLA